MAGANSPKLDPLFLAFQAALAGRYSIEREIGRGGMGVVYLAREVHLDRPVAIKLLPPERAADDSLTKRFLREARLAAKLSHPNIIPIHAVEDRGGFVFYVMTFVDGDTLAQRVRQRGPLPASEGTRLVREAAWALAHAHAEGVVHRDVKPDNILIERATGRVLVADFGIAAAIGEAAGADGVTGTPEFMSPEHALGKEVDARSDIYSLGATAFYALSGRLPFEGLTPTEVLAKHITEAAPALASLGVTVPRKVAHLVDRCLAKDPAHRPESATALAEQLGVALEQRREVPAALRLFVKKKGRFDSLTVLVLPGLTILACVGIGKLVGPGAAWATFAAAMVGIPLNYMVRAARQLAKQGFAHVDLAPAFASAVEESREEHALELAKGPSRVEGFLRKVTYWSGPVAIGSLAALIGLTLARANFRSDLVYWLSVTLSTAGPTSVVSLVLYLSALQERVDVDTGFWQRVWAGPVGRFAFRIARKLLGSGAVTMAMTHRATEISLGLAAEQLYEALPKATRAALGDLPVVLHRLQSDAQRLRASHDALQDALAEAGDVAAGVEYADVRATRDELHAKLGEAVGALETMRLSLLRLHAGSDTVEGLTTHVGIAAAVSEEVDRLLAAKAEVSRVLAFPRETAATPA